MGCGRRFTTFERLEESPIFVIKRSGRREAFDRTKIVRGVASASKNRPVSAMEVERLTDSVEESIRSGGPEVTSERIGREILDRLKGLDDVAYLRFASVYKGFEAAGDFERELGLLTKATPPKAIPPL